MKNMNTEKEPHTNPDDAAPQERAAGAEEEKAASEAKPEEAKTEAEGTDAASASAAEKEDGPAAELAPKKKKKPSFFRSEKFKHGSTATVFTAGFIAVVILLNVIVGILGERFPSVNLDMTKSGSNSLSADALKIVQGVKTPVDITICASKQDCQSSMVTGGGDYAEVSRLFEEAAERNAKITLSYEDLDKNPTFAQQYKSDNLTAGDVIVHTGKRYRVLTSTDLFTSQTDSNTYATTYYSNVDASLASALNYVTSAVVPVAAFDTGHSEKMDPAGYKKILSGASFETKDFNLLTDQIPDGTRLLVLGCPASDYTDAELEKIEKYLTDASKAYDRTVLVSYSAGEGNLSKLDAYLAEWGLSAEGDKAIVESDGSKYVSNGLNFFAEVQSTPDLGGGSASYQYLLTPSACPVSIKSEGLSGKTTYALVKSSETAALIKTGENAPSSDKAAQTVVALSQSSVKNGDTTYHANMILSGSAMLFSSQITGTSAFSNGAYLTTLSKYATGTSQTATDVVTTQRQLYAPDITISENGIRWLGFGVFTILFPLAVAVAGIVVYRRRRTL